MTDRKPVTQTMTASKTRQHFSSVVNRVFRGEERIIVERSGIPVAAIISAAELKRFDDYQRKRAERFKIVDEMRAAFADVSPEEIERETAKALAEVRAERRAERQAEQEREAERERVAVPSS